MHCLEVIVYRNDLVAQGHERGRTGANIRWHLPGKKRNHTSEKKGPTQTEVSDHQARIVTVPS